MESFRVAIKIEELCKELDTRKEGLEAFVKLQKLRKALVALNKKIEIETVKAKFDDKMPVSIIGNIVKGKCADEFGDYEQADIEYRSAVKLIEATEAQLNGWQSYNRYLDKGVVGEGK
jgi:hypothetical protein